MRYGIFSDVHSNLEALQAVMEAYKDESIDKFLCAGDVVGYGADPKECIGHVKRIAVVTVAGNHDWAAVDLFPTDCFNPIARKAIDWTRGFLDSSDANFLKSLKLLYETEDLILVHGTLDYPAAFNYMADEAAAECSFALLDKAVCFLGHTHIPGVFIRYENSGIEYMQREIIRIEEGRRYIINTGSVGQPRDSRPEAVYCIYDAEKGEVQIKRCAYDVIGARKKIIDRGLPRILGDRLLVGQ